MTPDRTTHRVRLRDVTLADADLLDEWGRAMHREGGFNDFGREPDPVDRDLLSRGPLRTEVKGALIVERIADGQPVGSVGWHQVASYGPLPDSAAWNIGIELVPSARGHGYGTEAQQLLADHLFETTPVYRIEATTDIENLAEQRSLEKAGFRREGVLRGAQFRAGAFHDLVLYSRLRDDPD